ncbi:MAG: hypothetical protein PHI64_05320 [Zoogloea sp.]|nr:hypothetical protein [Zoogloea sp.]MDD2988365.1 hypothetical protein [Zoogloea sp.]
MKNNAPTERATRKTMGNADLCGDQWAASAPAITDAQNPKL